VTVPKKFQEAVLCELHVIYPGLQHMKSLAHGHNWWHGLEEDIDQVVKLCKGCQEVKISSSCPTTPMGLN